MSDTEQPIVEPKKKKKVKIIKVKKKKVKKEEEPVQDEVKEEVPEEVEKPKKKSKKDKVKEEPVQDEEIEQPKKKVKKVKKVKKEEPVVEEEVKEEIKDVQEELDEVKEEVKVDENVVDAVGLDNVELDADAQTVLDEEEKKEVDELVQQQVKRVELTVIEEEFVDISKKVMEMSHGLRIMTDKLDALYKKVLGALDGVEEEKKDVPVVPNEAVELNVKKKTSKAFQKLFKKRKISKCDAMEMVLEYIREHGLTSDDEERNITCDEDLKELLGVEECKYFDVSGLVDKHLT